MPEGWELEKGDQRSLGTTQWTLLPNTPKWSRGKSHRIGTDQIPNQVNFSKMIHRKKKEDINLPASQDLGRSCRDPGTAHQVIERRIFFLANELLKDSTGDKSFSFR